MNAAMRLNRDEIIQICRLSGGEDFVCKRKNLVVYALLNFKSL